MSIFDYNNSLTFANAEELKSSLVADFPLVINVEPTSRCNLRCSFCFYKTYAPPQGDLERDLARSIAAEIVEDNRKLSLVALHKDGEPLLYKDLGWLIHLLKSTDNIEIIHLNTNATLLDEEKSRELITSGLDSITFSIDAEYNETYKRLKGVDKLDLVRSNVLNFCSVARCVGSPKTRAKIMRTPDVADEEVKDFFAYWDDKVTVVQDHYVHNWSGEVEIDVASQRLKRYACPLPWYVATISWDGEVSLCSFDYNRTTSIGRLDYVNGITLHKLWVGEKAKRSREALLNHDWKYMKVCENCINWANATNIEEVLKRS